MGIEEQIIEQILKDAINIYGGQFELPESDIVEFYYENR